MITMAMIGKVRRMHFRQSQGDRLSCITVKAERILNCDDAKILAAHASHRRTRCIDFTLWHSAVVDRVVEWDSTGKFDLFCDMRDGNGFLHQPLFGVERSIIPRSREAFLSWAPGLGHVMLAKAELVGCGAYAGVEG